MTALRLFAIILIFVVVGIAWMILGGTLEYRTANLNKKLSAEVDSSWGPAGVTQLAPLVGGTDATHKGGAQAVASDINVNFTHHNRYKGLLWFSTYTVRFTGIYTYSAETTGRFIFRLPAGVPRFGDLKVSLDDEPLDVVAPVISGNIIGLPLPDDDKEHTVMVSYQTFGRDTWVYDVTPEGETATILLRNFSLTATTNFTDIDYTKGSAFPTTPAEKFEKGVKAIWNYESERTLNEVSIVMPSRKNAEPVAARMSYFAPVGLLFFFTVLFTIVILKKIPLHPMHYLFISAGFFSFHILLAYLVDHIDLRAAFWICAAVSVFMVVAYMRLVASVKFAVTYIGLAQVIYLVGFSYAFFWPGKTGITVVIGAIVTLFCLMMVTGRVDWDEVFRKKPLLVAMPVDFPLPDEPADLANKGDEPGSE